MKKPGIFFLFIVLSLLLVACQSNEVTENNSLEKSAYGQLPSSNNGLIMEIQEENIPFDTKEFKLKITNLSKSNYIFDSYYTVEKKFGDNWYIIPFKKGSLFQDNLNELAPSQSLDFIIPIEYLQPNFNEGKYRIIKKVKSNKINQEIILATNFNVTK
ncbi:MAG: immunoglobulin-like domain-containing protein [Clostridium sp.]